MANNWKLYGLTGILVLLLLGAWYISYKPGEKIKVYEFAGNMERMEGDTVWLKGNYSSEEVQGLSGPENELVMEVKFTPDTKAEKVTWVFPPEAEKTGIYDFSLATKGTVEGSLEDWKALGLNGMIVRSEKNIYGKTQMEAASFRYFAN